MSFQHFRLSTPIVSQPTTFDKDGVEATPSPFVQTLQQTVLPSSQQSLSHPSVGQTKGPYGSGDADDGYTMVFASEAVFQEWRRQEEEETLLFRQTEGQVLEQVSDSIRIYSTLGHSSEWPSRLSMFLELVSWYIPLFCFVYFS